MKKKRPEPRLYVDIDIAVMVRTSADSEQVMSIRELLLNYITSPVEEWYEEAIPIEWLESTLTQFICSGKLKSSDAAVVYILIHEWRKTYETDRR